MLQGLAQRRLKRHQFAHAIIAKQHERTMVASAMKAHNLIERDIESRQGKALSSLPRARNQILRRLLNKIAQVIQRDMQALRA